jgi:hypothetical protein
MSKHPRAKNTGLLYAIILIDLIAEVTTVYLTITLQLVKSLTDLGVFLGLIAGFMASKIGIFGGRKRWSQILASLGAQLTGK